MTTQINLRVSDDFLKMAKLYVKENGFLNVQEFLRIAARDRIYESLEVRPEYLKKLKSKEANTFLSDKESEKFEEEQMQRAIKEMNEEKRNK